MRNQMWSSLNNSMPHVHRINVSSAAYALNSFRGVRSEATEWRKDDSSVMWEGRGGKQQF